MTAKCYMYAVYMLSSSSESISPSSLTRRSLPLSPYTSSNVVALQLINQFVPELEAGDGCPRVRHNNWESAHTYIPTLIDGTYTHELQIYNKNSDPNQKSWGTFGEHHTPTTNGAHPKSSLIDTPDTFSPLSAALAIVHSQSNGGLSHLLISSTFVSESY